MTSDLFALFSSVQAMFWSFFLVFLRVGAAMFLLPVFGETMSSVRLRIGIAVAFSFVVHPSVIPSDLEFPSAGASRLAAGLAECLAGLTIGIILRFHVMVIQIAASIAAQATSLAQLFGGAALDPQPALGMVLYLAALALAVELGLHVQFAMMFVRSYDIVPLGALVDVAVATAIRDAAGLSFEFGFILAAPFVLASLLYNLGLGVINRAMPQLMVAFVGAPAITIGALALLALTAPLMLALWSSALKAQLGSPFGVP